MKTFADVIDVLGGSIALAKALGRSAGTVSAWKTRNSIPSEHWAEIIALASGQGLEGITLESLASMVSSRKRASTTSEAA